MSGDHRLAKPVNLRGSPIIQVLETFRRRRRTDAEVDLDQPHQPVANLDMNVLQREDSESFIMPSAREIFIVDDDPSVQDSLSFLLTSAGYAVTCFASEEALRSATRNRCPDCILLDVVLPGRSGLEILKGLRNDGYPAPVVMMTGAGSVATAVASLKMGAIDFIEKPFDETDLILRLEQAMAKDSNPIPNLKLLAGQNFPGRQPLTRREREVFHQILRGQSNKGISDELGISPRTAEVHRAAIMKKLHARSTADLLRLAFTRQIDDAVNESEGTGSEETRRP